jgi:deoxyribose-phosphate aldolase
MEKEDSQKKEIIEQQEDSSRDRDFQVERENDEHVAKRVRAECFSLPPDNRRILDLLDFTLLDHDATSSQLEQFCCIANASIPAAVCVFSEHVKFVKNLLDSRVSVAAVAAGFPIGSVDVEDIKSSILNAVDAGADEIDCVLEPRFEDDFPGTLEESKLKAMREASSGRVLKIILETSLLDESAIRLVSQMALRCGADFLKTSTGKRGGCTTQSATFLAEEVNSFLNSSGERKGVKLSGGIRSIQGANDLLNFVIEKYPSVTGSETMLDSVKSLTDLSRDDSKRLRIGASGIMEELMPALYPSKAQTLSDSVKGNSQSPIESKEQY